MANRRRKMLRISPFLYRFARRMNDLEAIIYPSRLLNRIKNKIIGRMMFKGGRRFGRLWRKWW